MPTAAKRICNKCKKLSTNCICKKEKTNWSNKKHRSDVQKLYGSARWKKTRVSRLKLDEYLCVQCKANNRLTPAAVVDHIQSVGEVGVERFIKNFFIIDKLQSLCDKCHKDKTSTHDSKLSMRR